MRNQKSQGGRSRRSSLQALTALICAFLTAPSANAMTAVKADKGDARFYIQREYGAVVYDNNLAIHNQGSVIRISMSMRQKNILPYKYILPDYWTAKYDDLIRDDKRESTGVIVRYNNKAPTDWEYSEPGLVVDSPQRKVIRFELKSRPEGVILLAFAEVQRGDPSIHYFFQLLSPDQEIKNASIQFTLASRYNFDVFGNSRGETTKLTEDVHEFPGWSGWNGLDWVSAYSTVRGEGMVISGMPGSLALSGGIMWVIGSTVQFGDIAPGSNCVAALFLDYMAAPAGKGRVITPAEVAANVRRCRESHADPIRGYNSDPIPAVWLDDYVQDIPDKKDIAWARQRAQTTKVYRFGHTAWTEDIDHRIATLLDLGFNVISIGYLHAAMAEFDHYKAIVRRIHNAGAKVWLELEYTLTDKNNIHDLTKRLLDPALGDACADGVGWDVECAPREIGAGWVFNADNIWPTDEEYKLYHKETGRYFVNSTIDQIMEWSAKRRVSRWAEFYRFMKQVNPKAELYVIANMYETHLAHAFGRMLPDAFFLPYEHQPYPFESSNPFGRTDPSRQIYHQVRAWKNAGVKTIWVGCGAETWQYYRANTFRAALEAGADGFGIWYARYDGSTQEINADLKQRMNYYFPGDLKGKDPATKTRPEYYGETGIFHHWAARTRQAMPVWPNVTGNE